MIVATYNVNGINKRLASLQRWLEARRPDVACLQEIKCYDRDFPHRELAALGYGAIWHGQGPHHGVAILARGAQPLETRRGLPGDASDREARYLEAAVEGVLVGCLYAPNGNPQPGPKFVYKLAWNERFIEHAAELEATGAPVLLAGDYNVVPTDGDIYNMRSWLKNALVQPEPRAQYKRLVDSGWTDALRDRFPDDAALFTFWSYFRDSWSRDAGMRLDHVLLCPSLHERLTAAGIDREVRGFDSASDHAPAWIELSAP